MSMTQNLIVYGHLRKGPITPLAALRLYGIQRLSARIHNLRERGIQIQSCLITVRTRQGKARVAQYRLAAGS